jgi:DNA-directed RNA polymerase subunit RPC12/RpoP
MEVTMNDGMVRKLVWRCPVCGANDGVDYDEVRTREVWWGFYLCRACGRPTDPTNVLGARLVLAERRLQLAGCGRRRLVAPVARYAEQGLPLRLVGRQQSE